MSTVLESGDHALQITYRYFFTKLTSTSRSELLKKVSCANTEFFVRVRTSTLLFSRTNSQQNHRSTTETMSDGLRIIGRWPQEPSDTISDAFPRLRCPRGFQFRRGADETASTTAQRWDDGTMMHSSCFSAQDVLRRGDQ